MIGIDKKTGNAAMEILTTVIDYYNRGYDAELICMATGLSRVTVEVFLDIARAVEDDPKTK